MTTLYNFLKPFKQRSLHFACKRYAAVIIVYISSDKRFAKGKQQKKLFFLHKRYPRSIRSNNVLKANFINTL